MRDTAEQLVKSILGGDSGKVRDKQNLWDIIEDMSTDDFILLRKNVNFANLLRFFGVEILGEQKLRIILKNNTEISSQLSTDRRAMKRSYIEIGGESAFDLEGIPPLSARLDNLVLPNRFSKLVKRLRNVGLSHTSFSLGDTLGDLVTMSSSDIASLPGIGKSYVETFKDLKRIVSAKTPINNQTDNSALPNGVIEHGKVDTSNMRLFLGRVDEKSKKSLEKYARHVCVNDLAESLDDVLSLDPDALLMRRGFGAHVVDDLVKFRDEVRREVSSILAGKIDYQNLESALIVPKVFSKLSVTQIEQVLLDDIDNFLENMEKNDVDIAQQRWGFIEGKASLEQIGHNLGVTRERVRQKEKKINRHFVESLRINSNSLWQLIEPELDPNFSTKFKKIRFCFTTEKDFYYFLGMICGQTNLYDYVYPQIEKTILNTLFAENGAPIHVDDAKDYISQLSANGIKNIDNVIQALREGGVVLIDGNDVWPRQLGKAEASACVLFPHEAGLPWGDVARLVNRHGYSRTNIYQDRLDTEAFKLPDYIFLAGKGIYKHTRFIDVESISLDDIFIELMEYAESGSRNVFHLTECFQASNRLQEHDYYVIRHFVKYFGEDYGFYFEGRSQSDSVGLKKGFKNLTQKDVIVEAMSRSDRPLTKTTIASLLKSKSSGHAAYYLDGLIEEGKVVQVDRMLYTTPSRAYSNIVLDDYVSAIGEILHRHQSPVHPSILQEELNRRFSKCYTKYFYASIARLNAGNKGWFRKHGLYSINELPFGSLKSAIEKVCDLELSESENIKLLKKQVAITEEVASRAVANWRRQFPTSLMNLPGV